ncbi:MAG: hypothetical protein ACI9TA_002787, partial [Reinekea sp.]
FTTITELAEHENLALTYMTRVLRLTLLAPDIIEAVLEGRQPPEVTLAVLLEPFPVEWKEQVIKFLDLELPDETFCAAIANW